MTSPDVLFIITDHHAWYGHFVSPNGRPGGIAPCRLPVWERFCNEGVLFSQAYTVCPLCTPARSSMMTGLAPIRHHLCSNTCLTKADFLPGTELYSHHLAKAGYRNAYVGKWHCGHSRLPIDYGIEGWSLPDYGVLYTSKLYRDYCAEHGLGDARALIERSIERPELTGAIHTLHNDSPWYYMDGYGVLQGPRAGHEADFVATLGVERLHELTGRSQPFSLVTSFWAPHQPFYPSEPFAGMVDPPSIAEHPSFRDDLAGKPRRWFIHRDTHNAHPIEPVWTAWQPALARCYEQCLQTDAAVGLVLDELERSGRAGNTIVVWCADHGDAIGGHGGLWDKDATMSEEVMRIPLAVRWPHGLQPGGVCPELVSNLDCPATILDAAGCSVPTSWQSRSLLPVARGEERRRTMVCEHHGHHTPAELRMLRMGNWKYVAALYDGGEFYDLTNDPWELHNRIDDPACAGIRAECQAQIRAHLDGEPQSHLVRNLQRMME